MLDDLNLLIVAWQIHLLNPIRKTTCKSHILSPEVNTPVLCLRIPENSVLCRGERMKFSVFLD